MIDAELMRRLMLMLEARQQSPRQIVIVLLPEEAAALDSDVGAIADGLDRLLALGYIDGPGMDDEGFFLFRKLTRRGTQFVDAARRPRDWDRLKKQNAALISGP